MDNRPIGVFDSGLGGLSIVRQLVAALPSEDIVYFGDTGRVPYGTRSQQTIIRYAREDIDFLLQHDVKMIIAACGTVSAVLPQSEIARLPVPFFGVLASASNAACRDTRSGRIGVIGTASAVNSGAYQRYIRNVLPQAEIFTQPCPLFVPLVENGLIADDNRITNLTAEMYLAPIRSSDVDVLILGCTHYPLISGIISKAVGPDVALIDTGKETVIDVAGFLAKNDMLHDKDSVGTRRYFVSDDIDGFSGIAEELLGEKITNIEKVDFEK